MIGFRLSFSSCTTFLDICFGLSTVNMVVLMNHYSSKFPVIDKRKVVAEQVGVIDGTHQFPPLLCTHKVEGVPIICVLGVVYWPLSAHTTSLNSWH